MDIDMTPKISNSRTKIVSFGLNILLMTEHDKGLGRAF